MAQRLSFIDSMKFVLIFFVILGHMLECNRDSSFNMKVYAFIYSFHMPAFILLSGYFAKLVGGVNLFLG
jgi:fucose 4-O-acetylase-like acetyltransferase